MAVVENKATTAGDVLIIKTDVPIVGIVSLTAFVDTVTGETGTVYFEKKFRYSTNGGITFSDWIDLTTINIQNIVIERIDYFVIEYRYKRVGEEAGDLAFENVTLSGTHSPLAFPVFNNIFFSNFFTVNDVDVLTWALNVLEKLYKRGIIPNYVIREAGDDDTDYVSFWFALTHFFAVLVHYARRLETISGNVTLMREFVKGRGIYMRDNPDVDELYRVYTNYVSEIQKRGTTLVSKANVVFDGEVLRLINNIVTDEFLFAYTNRGELGWCIGESSPLYTGADNIINLIKGYEFTPEVTDLSKYPLINDDYITLVGGKMRITNCPNGEVTGIGVSENTEAGGDGYLYYGYGVGIELIYPDALIAKALIIDPALDYEISFKVSKQLTYVADLSFGVALFDSTGTQVSAARITDGVLSDRFFTLQTLNQPNVEYWVRGVLYNHNTELIANDILNIGFGQGLRAPLTAKYLVPVILVENNTGIALQDVVDIADVKIRPAQLWFSRGTLSARNIIISWLRNRSVDYNNVQVKHIIDEQLIPYNTFSLIKFLL